MYYLGFDIGGTACAVVLGRSDEACPRVVGKRKFPTTVNPQETIRRMLEAADEILLEHSITMEELSGVGITCGSPLSSAHGMILSPPNLPGWDNIEIVEIMRRRFGVRAFLQNDANACALAEWKHGAGRGTRNMIYVTCGTGFGAGLILNGQLYKGISENAGEIGHVRMDSFGPVGYGKAGSLEGFCSGGGIGQMGRIMALERIQVGDPPAICETVAGLDAIDIQVLGEAAENGDAFSAEVFRRCGDYMGRGLALLIDILNPELIVLGGSFAKYRRHIYDPMMESLERESLKSSLDMCRFEPSELGDSLDDIASLVTAIMAVD